jgi:succinyl-CoA synthetase alpha subunit
MSILVDRSTRVLVQGITGQAGSFHTEKMLAYGTQVVAGVTPGKRGASVHGVPVFNTVREAVDATDADATVIFVPARFACEAILEAIEAALALIVVITEGIPVWDMLRVRHRLARLSEEPLKAAAARQTGPPAGPAQGADGKGRAGGSAACPIRLIGPNCPGLITPGACKIGIMPGDIHRPGAIGVLSRSGTLTYDAVDQLTRAGLGQSTCVGIGGDPVLGSSFVDLLPLFEQDAATDAIVLIGEIGGAEEEAAAACIAAHVTKPVFAFVAGKLAPQEKRMGHAGAIIAGGRGSADEKIAALRQAGVTVMDSPADIGRAVKAGLEARQPARRA